MRVTASPAAAGGCNGGVLDGYLSATHIPRTNTEAVTDFSISARRSYSTASDFNVELAVDAATVLAIVSFKWASPALDGAACNTKCAIADHATAQHSRTANACDIAAGDCQGFRDKNAKTISKGSGKIIALSGNGTARDDNFCACTVNTGTPATTGTTYRCYNATVDRNDTSRVCAVTKTITNSGTACGVHLAAVNGDITLGPKAATITIAPRSDSITTSSVDSAISDGDRATGSNAAAIPPTPDSITSRGGNVAAVDSDRVRGVNAYTVPASFPTCSVHCAVLDGDSTTGANAVTGRGRGFARDIHSTAVNGDRASGVNAAAITICGICGIAPKDRQRGAVLAAYGETAAAQIDAAAGADS